MMASGLLSKLVYWRSKIMAKKFKGEDGKVYVQKKPIYKRWWFLLLAVAVIGSLATGGGDDEAATDTAANETEIAAKLSLLIEHPEKIIAISKNARNFIEKQHDYKTIATKYLACWEA